MKFPVGEKKKIWGSGERPKNLGHPTILKPPTNNLEDTHTWPRKPGSSVALLLRAVGVYFVVVCSATFGQRQEPPMVFEDSIQDAAWKTILRGPRPPSVRWEKQRNEGDEVQRCIEVSASFAKTSLESVNLLRRCTRQLKPRSNGRKTHSMCWAMPMRLRSRIWNGPLTSTALTSTDASCGATRVGTDQFHERIHRAEEETVGCRRGGSHRGCQASRRVHPSFGTGGEAPRIIAKVLSHLS